jgi:hypothetical protein
VKKGWAEKEKGGYLLLLSIATPPSRFVLLYDTHEKMIQILLFYLKPGRLEGRKVGRLEGCLSSSLSMVILVSWSILGEP